MSTYELLQDNVGESSNTASRKSVREGDQSNQPDFGILEGLPHLVSLKIESLSKSLLAGTKVYRP